MQKRADRQALLTAFNNAIKPLIGLLVFFYLHVNSYTCILVNLNIISQAI